MQKILLTIVLLYSIASCGYAADVLQNNADLINQNTNVITSENTDKASVLVLLFDSQSVSYMTEQAYSKLLEQNLENTGAFAVTSYDEAKKAMQDANPKLLPCYDKGCGSKMAKILGINYIITGQITLQSKDLLKLRVALLNVLTNQVESEDTIYFSDLTRDDKLYKLAIDLQRNIVLYGRIIDANSELAVINLGKRQGVSVGDKFVIYDRVNLQNAKALPLEKTWHHRDIGILTINKVDEITSEGSYFQTIDTPKPLQRIRSYLSKRKQADLIASVRRKLDVHLRHIFEIKKEIKVRPVVLIDVGKLNWEKRLASAKSTKAIAQGVAIGLSAVTLGLGVFYRPTLMIPFIIGLAASGYSTYYYFSSASDLDHILDEGRYKHYIDFAPPKVHIPKKKTNQVAVSAGFKF